jgi:phage shock protein PspC (stress-responsive transcriptional regulator)
MVGGVAGGLAEYSGVDALLWRVGFVALALAGGTGVLVYLLLWLLMPATPAGQPAGQDASGSRYAAQPRLPAGPRSPVARITLAGLLIVVGVLVLITRFTTWDLGARGFLEAALLVVGLGLIASAFVPGRTNRGGLIAIGIVLSIALAVSSAAPWHCRGCVGDRSYRPLTAADVHPVYDAGVGNTTVDLSAVDLATAATPLRTRIDGGVGNLHVVLPDSADVQVTVDAGLGHVDVLGNGSTNGYYAGTGSAAWSNDGNPEFVLTIDAGIGNVEVDRA